MNRKEFLLKASGLILFSGIAAAGLTQDPPPAEEKIKKFTVIAKRCDGCGHCFRSCRDKALQVTETGKAYINSEKCKGCGDCTKFCRRMAIVELESK